MKRIANSFTKDLYSDFIFFDDNHYAKHTFFIVTWGTQWESNSQVNGLLAYLTKQYTIQSTIYLLSLT